ncbi:MAG: hypothetical protein HYX89_03260 [Chloroflexi bacterium]|nr:hypothetical protein [Chloroflexota bacterium]
MGSLITPLTIFAIYRVSLSLLAYLAFILLPMQSFPSAFHAFPDQPWLDGWARWDSWWYVNIVQHGYTYDPGGESSVAFFPLYPLAIKSLTWLIPNPYLAGMIVSNGAFLLALILFHRLTALRLGKEAALWATLFLAFSPFAFFFSAVYTEALFLLLAVGAFYFAERRNWLLASLAGMLASGTRLVGIGILPALAILFWERRRTQAPLSRMAYLAIAPAGLGAYMLYLWSRFGDPLAFLKTSMAGWNIELSLEMPQQHRILDFVVEVLPTQGFQNPEGYRDMMLFVNFLTAIAFLASLYLVYRKLGLSYTVFAFLAIALPFSSTIDSLGRYMLVVFPSFMALGSLGRHQLFATGLLLLPTLFLSLFTALFVTWHWVV